MSEPVTDSASRRPGPGPVDLAARVEASPGSVVSQVLFRSESAVVTVFSFAEGEGLTEHTTPHDAFVHLLEGSVRIEMEGEEQLVRAGELLHIPPSVPHTLHGGEPFKMLLTLAKKGLAG